MSKNTKLNIQLAISSVMAIGGVFLLIAGFYVVPVGEIHGSVNLAVGQVLTFVGALCGVDYHYKSKTGDKD